MPAFCYTFYMLIKSKISKNSEEDIGSDKNYNKEELDNTNQDKKSSQNGMFNRLYFYFTLLLIIFIFVSSCIITFQIDIQTSSIKRLLVEWSNKMHLRSSAQLIGTPYIATPIPTPIITPNPTPKPKQWVLQKNSNGQYVPQFSLCAEHCDNSIIISWNDWLFYSNGAFDNKDSSVYGYHLTSGIKKTIFSLETYKDMFWNGDNRLPYRVNDLQVINEKLYFTQGGYLARGAVFWVDLPISDNQVPQKLSDIEDGHIKFWENRYWVKGWMYDGCSGRDIYKLFDPSVNSVKNVAESFSGCAKGEKFIAIDKKDRMILAYHTGNENPQLNIKNLEGIFTYVIAIPLSTPEVKEGVIAQQNMPSEITDIRYIHKSDQLLLIGSQNYLYDLDSKVLSISENTEIPEKENQFYERTLEMEKAQIKEQIDAIKLPEQYRFVLE